ncbi:MAG: hypothetical protein IPL65_05380 [Lewinellaceae bacterium]|nr:hypothetical protein [Lewinellaceae bacterium]
MKTSTQFFLPFLLMLFLLPMADTSFAQGCTGITFSFEHYEPCKFRAKYANTTDCFTEIWYVLESGTFSSWNVNTAAGFQVEEWGPGALRVFHNQGFLPLGNQIPLLFTLPTDLNTNMLVSYNDQCAQVGCEIIGGIPIESCPDPGDGSIIGVTYRECGNLPYSDQPLLPGWTIELLDDMGNVLGEQVTDANGAYAFYDLHAGIYIIREAILLTGGLMYRRLGNI